MNRPSAKRSARNAANGMGDLFGGPELPTELPAGFRYISNVLSSAEEKSLVQQFEKLPLKPFESHGYQGNRRIYTFGHRYIFAGQDARADARIPDYLRLLTEIASRTSGMPANAFEQLMLTEYAPGAGIGWHRDRPTMKTSSRCLFSRPVHSGCAGR
jgi:alkylated DNA repair dioxygenase AlkB